VQEAFLILLLQLSQLIEFPPPWYSMRRTVIFTSLALVALTEAAANAQDTESYWQQAVTSDKESLNSAISNMETVAQEYRRASQNRTHAAALSLNLAEKAFSDAHDHAKQGKQRAVTDFNNALRDLKSASNSSEVEKAEKAAKQKAAEVDRVERQEAEDAKQRLRTQRSGESSKVSETFGKAKTAANNLLRDRSHLERAMRRNGKSEREYEGLSEQLEHHAERQRDYAEDNKDRAADAVEHIFEHAQDHLNDREQELHDRASDARQQAMEEATASYRSQQAKQQSAAKSAKDQSAQASPMASALNLVAKADAKTEAAHTDTKVTKEQKRKEEQRAKEQQRKEEEKEAQQTVDSDKTRLSSAMQSLDKVKQSMTNKTRAEALVASVAQDSLDEAAENKRAEKQQAQSDFNKYLLEFKSASPTGKWSSALKKVEDQARYLDKLDDEESRDAHKRLHSKHASQKSEVKGTYYEAYRAASNLLRDRNRLQNAMRRAGAKERDYEAEEEKNEALGESSQDKAEDLHDTATDATEDIYERAEEKLDGLQHASRKDQHAASQERHRQVQDALKTFKNAAKKTEKQSEKTYTKATQKKGDAIEGTEGSEENESGLEQIQKQMKSLQKGIPTAAAVASQELLDAPVDFSSLCLLTAASVAFLVFFYVRRTRPNPVAPPLLG
jgi:hypothetical protein